MFAMPLALLQDQELTRNRASPTATSAGSPTVTLADMEAATNLAWEKSENDLSKAEETYHASPDPETEKAWMDRVGEAMGVMQLRQYFNNHNAEATSYVPRQLAEVVENAPGSTDQVHLKATIDNVLLNYMSMMQQGRLLELVALYEPALQAHRETCTTCEDPWKEGESDGEGGETNSAEVGEAAGATSESST